MKIFKYLRHHDNKHPYKSNSITIRPIFVPTISFILRRIFTSLLTAKIVNLQSTNTIVIFNRPRFLL